MHYPQIQIDRQKLIYNTRRILELCDRSKVNLHIVTKGVCAYRPVVDAMVEAGAQFFADTKIGNFEKLAGYGSSHLMLRIPMISEAADVVRLCDLSLASDYDVLCALSDAAMAQDRRHGVILMTELGDLREGFPVDEIIGMAGKVLELRGLFLAGIGANFNCYGGVIGDETKLNQLVALTKAVKERYEIHVPLVSGGNSGLIYLLEQDRLPEGINHVRIGEGLLFGRETSYGKRVADLYTDIFTIRAEVIECRRKGSIPDGEIGPNAFGEHPVFEDRGMIRRAILALGRQDTAVTGLEPKLSGMTILGSSFDHMILDVTNAVHEVKTGDIIEFNVNYAAMHRAMTSPYVYKRMV
jgi:predicted amino acid racemase